MPSYTPKQRKTQAGKGQNRETYRSKQQVRQAGSVKGSGLDSDKLAAGICMQIWKGKREQLCRWEGVSGDQRRSEGILCATGGQQVWAVRGQYRPWKKWVGAGDMDREPVQENNWTVLWQIPPMPHIYQLPSLSLSADTLHYPRYSSCTLWYPLMTFWTHPIPSQTL